MREINSNRSVWSSKCGDMIIGSTLRSSQGAQISWKPWESPLEHVRRKHYIVEISFGIVPTFRVATTTNINTVLLSYKPVLWPIVPLFVDSRFVDSQNVDQAMSIVSNEYLISWH